MPAKKQPQVFDVFANAKSVAAPKVEKPGKKERHELDLGQDLETYAAIDTMIKALKSLQETIRPDLDERIKDEFVNLIAVENCRPDNFRGVSEKATASCELRKRSSASVLNEQELQVLDAYKVPTDEKVIQEAVEERYFFNPEILADQRKMKKISEALSNVPELENLILRQEPREAVTARVVSDDSLKVVCSMKSKKAIAELLPIIFTTAIKPALKDAEIETAFEILRRAGLNLGVEDKKAKGK